MFALNKSAVSLCLVVSAFVVAVGCARTPAQKEARFMKRGQDLVAKHDYQRAILEYRNAIQAMPKDAEPVYQLALVYMDMHDFRMAFALLKKAVDVNPQHNAAQLAIAKFQIGAPDAATRDEARQRVEGVLARKPNDPDALNTLAALDLKAQNSGQAIQDLQKAFTASPKDLLSASNLSKLELRQGDAAGAESVLKQAVQNAPQSSQAALALGQFYLRTGKNDLAEAQVKRAVQLDPKNANALILLGAFQIKEGRNSEAEQTYRQISALPGSSLRPIYAVYLLREGKRDQAIGELKRLVKEDPNNREVRSLLVSSYMEAGQPQESQRVLDEALKRNPKDADALLQRSTFFFNQGKLDQTAADLRTVLAANPDSAEAHYGLARVAAARGSALLQSQELAEALKLNPHLLAARVDLSQLLRAKDPKAALDLMNETPADQKAAMAYVVERNWVLLALKDNAELRKNLDAELAHQRTPELLYQDALLKASQKDFAAAQRSAEELVSQQPQNAQAVDLLAKTYAAAGTTGKALQIVQDSAARTPKSASLESLLGMWQANTHHLDQARQAFSNAVADDTNYMPARLALADIDMVENNPAAARQELQAVLGKQPANMEAKLRMAMVEEKTGNRSAARDDLRAVVQAQPQNEFALNELAYNLAGTSPDEALKYAQTAVSLAPDDPAAQDTLGYIYYRKNLYDSALSYFKTAVQKQPTATRKYHLALAYSKMGDKQLAAANLKGALQMDPKLQMPEPVVQ